MRDPDTIEREIAFEREGLAQSLKALDARLSPEALVETAADALRDKGSAFGEMAKDNPLGVALIGAGVAWFLAGPKANAKPETPPPAAAAYDPRVGPTSPGLSQPTPPMAGFDDRVAAADRAMQRIDHEGDEPMTMTDTHSTSSSARAHLRESADKMRARLHDGLDQLPEGARARILSARLAAIDAQAAVEAQFTRGSDSLRRTAKQNPLLLGAIAFGLGAAVAAAMPRTSVENHSIGARRDALLDEADRMFREESDKLRAVAEAAVAEGKSAIKDTIRTGPPTEDNPAERVRKAAAEEADRQGVREVS